MTERLRLRAGAIDFAALAWGPQDGPLALCLHGYPDTAWTWRWLGPVLAERGWRVVAPWMRGYAPTGLAPDGCYQVGALVRDAVELHRVLGGDAALRSREHATAALRPYRAFFQPWTWRREYAAEQAHVLRVPAQPLLYLHGERDGCQLPAVARGAERVLPSPSRFELVRGAGHFLQLERPEHVNALVAAFVGDA